MKDTFQNPTTSIILLNDKLLEMFFKKSAIREGCLPSLLQHWTGDPSQYSKTRKKWHKAWKGTNTFLFFSDDRIIHMEHPKESTNKLLKISAY